MTISIRGATGSHLSDLVAIFTHSVHELAANSYSPAQREAWAPKVPDLAAWMSRLEKLTTYLAEVDSTPAGFLSVHPPAHIELLYTHPRFSRQGVASALYRHAILQIPESASLITTEASLEARPFFERQGFKVIEAQRVERNGQAFRRFRMTCRKDASEPA